MNHEVHQTMLFQDKLGLLVPQGHGVVVQNIEERMILSCSDR